MTYFLKQTVNFLITACKEWLLFLKKLIIVIFELFKKIDDKLNKNSSLLGIIFLIMLVVVVPIYAKSIINIIFHGDKLDSWLSFYGSYLGGILGGAATLAAVIRTTNQAKLMQEENKKETRKIQEENKILQLQNNNKAFVDELTSLVGEYCANISAYYYGIKENKEIRDSLKKVHDNYANGYITEQDYNHVKIIYENEKHEVNREKSNSIYFILKIKLDNVENSASLLNLIECMHGYYCFGYSENKSLIDNKQFSNFTNKILEETSRFTNNYLKNRNYI